MSQFRHHATGQVHSTSSEDETATYDDDPVWQRIEDDEPEQSVDDIIEELSHASADHRNLLRDALAAFEDDASELPAVDQFDPSAHSVADVQAHLKSLDHANDPAALVEYQRVIEAEKAGQARKTVVDLALTTTT